MQSSFWKERNTPHSRLSFQQFSCFALYLMAKPLHSRICRITLVSLQKSIKFEEGFWRKWLCLGDSTPSLVQLDLPVSWIPGTKRSLSLPRPIARQCGSPFFNIVQLIFLRHPLLQHLLFLTHSLYNQVQQMRHHSTPRCLLCLSCITLCKLRLSKTKVLLHYRRTPGCDSSENPLTWWRRNEKTFPTLARAAKRFLAIPASSAPSERAFSKINIVIDKRRASLLPENADKLCFLKHNCTLNL